MSDTRGTTIKLHVRWDPTTQDHPMAWGWDEALGCDVQFLDFEDDNEVTYPPEAVVKEEWK